MAAVTYGAGEVAFVDAASFGRANRREVIFRVEDSVAKDEVDFAVEVWRTGLGDDFDAAAAGTGKFRGVGIVIDADFLNGGGGDACALHLDAVDDEGDAAGGAGSGVEEWGQGGDVVLVEDGELF